MNKKGQIFTIDYIIGLAIFLFLLIISVNILITFKPYNEFDSIYRDNTYLSETLMTAGAPEDWNVTSVILPGLMNNNRLNLTKLNLFDSIDYETQKELMHQSTEFIFFFEYNNTILNITKCIRGYNISTNTSCQPQLHTVEHENLAKTERIIVHNNSLLKMVFYSWK